MSIIEISLILLALLLVLLCGGVWIALALSIVGYATLAFFTARDPGINMFTAMWGSNASWELASLPLFIWMGEILFRTKLSDQMFEGLAPWLDRIPGRLLHINILGCGIFGSVSGSSAATCATIAKVALPELKRRGYDEKIALGSLATAGTLGILIPPSITMVVYAVAADVSILKVFLAGFIPSAILMLLFSGYLVVWALLNPERVPKAGIKYSFKEKIKKSGNLIPVSVLIVFIIAVLLAGWATATECAAYGVLGSLAIAAHSRLLTWENFWQGLMSATRVSCMIMFILAGASFLRMGMGFTGIPLQLAEWIQALNLSKYELIAALCLFYILLGMALDGISMIVLTAAIVMPMVTAAGFDLIWFGIFVVLLVEIAEVTPPVGFNLFVLQNMTGRDSNWIAAASIPFFMMLVVCIAVITVWPELVTWLPNLVIGS